MRQRAEQPLSARIHASMKPVLLVIAAALALTAAGQAHAAGTPAGTTITNKATVSHTVGTVAMPSHDSNEVTITVAEVISVKVTAQDAAAVSVVPGQANAVTTFRVTNDGNGGESYTLSATGAGIIGDQFDPTVTAVYLDANANSVYDPGTDALYSSSTPTMTPDGFVTVFVLSSIPSTLFADGDTGNVRLTAASTTGTGTPGTVLAGMGDSGVDAIIGLSGGTKNATSAYQALMLTVSITKTATVTDPGSGSLLVPNSVIHYKVTATAAGTGTATNCKVTDPVPANTAYVAGTLRLNGTLLTDAADVTDTGDVGGTAAGTVTVGLGTLTSASAAQEITFDVKLDAGTSAGTTIANTATSHYQVGSVSDTKQASNSLAVDMYLLTVVKQGTGSGSVTPLSGSLSWSGNTGTESLASGATVTLTAAADSGSSFMGWTGCDSTSGAQCVVTMTAAKNVTATFDSITQYLLTVVKQGTGSGSVTPASGSLLWSGGTGTSNLASGATVTLTAAADSGSSFTSWAGCDSAIGSQCVVTMISAKNVTATFTSQYLLTVVKQGTGSGSVTPASGSLSWSGNTGTATLASGTTVTLTATADSGSSFMGWTGCDSASGSQCVVTMTAAKNVTATFDSITQYLLTVAKQGTGSGSVTPASGSLLWSGSTGTATLASGSTVTLTAAADSGSSFTSWAGCDSAIGSQCVVTMISAKNVTATFGGGTQYILTVLKQGTGSGSVTPASGSLLWSGSTGTSNLASGSTVTLTAAADSGSSFTSWAGCDSTSGSQCVVTMTANKTVTATFGGVSQHVLTGIKQGTGTGTVTPASGSLSWSGNTGTATLASGVTITLTATAAADSDFTGWTGCDSTSGSQCVAILTMDKTVTATFTAKLMVSITTAATPYSERFKYPLGNVPALSSIPESYQTCTFQVENNTGEARENVNVPVSLPANAQFCYVADDNAVVFESRASGLTYSGTVYSKNSGAAYDYAPAPDSQTHCDGSVTNLKVALNGSFAAGTYFEIAVIVRVK